MSVATNLLGQPISWHDKNANNGKGETYIGSVCAVYGQVDPRIAPRVAFVLVTGQIKSAPLDDLWLIELPGGTPTDLGKELLKAADDGGTGKTDS